MLPWSAHIAELASRARLFEEMGRDQSQVRPHSLDRPVGVPRAQRRHQVQVVALIGVLPLA